MVELPEGNFVTGPADLFIAPAGGEPFEGWTPIGCTDGGIQFTLIDTGSIAGLFEGFTARTLTVEATVSADFSDLLLGYAVGDGTAGRDTTPCAGSGGRWSDLMARIDDLVDE